MKTLLSKRHIRKKQALLLELMIALTIMTLCMIPLLKPYLFMQKEMKKREEHMQIQILAKEAAINVKTLLYDGLYSWEAIKANKVRGNLDSLTIHHADGSSKQVPVEFQLINLRSYRNSHAQSDYLYVQLELSFPSLHSQKTPHKTYLFLERKSEVAVS